MNNSRANQETKPTNIMLKTLLRISLASIAMAGVAAAGTVTAVSFGGSFIQAQAGGTPVSGGFVAVGTSSLTDAEITGLTDASTLAASFTQFGDSSTFGNAAVNNLAGYFSLAPSGNGGSADFNGNSIFLIGGNGSTIANSSSLFVIRSDTNFAADAPLFSASISLDDGNVLLGAIGGTNTVSPAFDAFQMADVGGIIPEPGVSILALFSAGLLVLRRRR